MKAAILSTLSIIISKGGIALKPFLPQLQTTFIKCLQDNARWYLLANFSYSLSWITFLLKVWIDVKYRTVRSSSALALGKLSALSTRVDPLVNDLLSTLQVGRIR